MLTDLGKRLRAVTRDTAIVLHQIGSHGPAYAERYPPEFERFKPACHSNELQRCTDEEIVNAYDSTIAYTDHVLAQLIALLRETTDKVDGMLIYVSDHGESLGEQGLYLHGMPYSLAPRVQKDVPMLIWTSKAYDARVGMRSGCVERRAGHNLSHDNLYHTILGAAGVSNQVYDRRLDILSGCKSESQLARIKGNPAPHVT
jgi:lipid A ethanolaminephosphotransferase